MKFNFQYIILIVFTGMFFSCKKDNFSAPSATLSGSLVYQGQPIGVERNQVPYELYQFGFGKVGPIGQTFAQDGSYSSLLFDGEYKFIIPNNQGPFMWKKTAGGAPDSLTINLKGSQTMDIEVTPFYMIRNAQLVKSGNAVTGNFKLEQIITGADARDIERATLYINKTQFVSPGENIGNSSISGGDITDRNNISLSVDIPNISPAQNYIFARVGVKIAGVEDMIFSPLAKIQF